MKFDEINLKELEAMKPCKEKSRLINIYRDKFVHNLYFLLNDLKSVMMNDLYENFIAKKLYKKYYDSITITYNALVSLIDPDPFYSKSKNIGILWPSIKELYSVIEELFDAEDEKIFDSNYVLFVDKLVPFLEMIGVSKDERVKGAVAIIGTHKSSLKAALEYPVENIRGEVVEKKKVEDDTFKTLFKDFVENLMGSSESISTLDYEELTNLGNFARMPGDRFFLSKKEIVDIYVELKKRFSGKDKTPYIALVEDVTLKFDALFDSKKNLDSQHLYGNYIDFVKSLHNFCTKLKIANRYEGILKRLDPKGTRTVNYATYLSRKFASRRFG